MNTDTPNIYGDFDDDDAENQVLLNATANTRTDAYHTHGRCNVFRKMKKAKISHRSVAEWHDVEECETCATERDHDNLTEVEALVATLAGEFEESTREVTR